MTMQIADTVSLSASDAKAREKARAAAARDSLRTEPPAVRIAIITLAVLFLSVFVVLPLVSEIAPLLIVIKLEQFDYAGAAAIGVIMLAASFLILLVINLVQRWSRRHEEH